MAVFQTAEDLARVFMNSAMMGLPNHLGPNAAENQKKLDAAQQRLGLAGDIADVAGFFVPGAGALKALKGVTKIPAAVRAAPRIAEEFPALAQRARVALTNAGGPAITKAEAAARLGIPYVPTLAERALGAAGRAAAATAAVPLRHPIISALVGAGGLAKYAHRNNAEGGGVHLTPAAAAAPAAQVASAADEQDMVNPEFLAAARGQGAVAAAPMDFSQLASMVAQANGGKISLRELGALSDIAAKALPRTAPAKPPTGSETAAQRAIALNEAITAQKQAAAKTQEEYMQATMEGLENYKQIAKARPTDPLAFGLPGDDGY